MAIIGQAERPSGNLRSLDGRNWPKVGIVLRGLHDVGDIVPQLGQETQLCRILAGYDGYCNSFRGASVPLAATSANAVVCGHSNCGAIRAIVTHSMVDDALNLGNWLDHARPAFAMASRQPAFGGGLSLQDRVLPS